MAGAEKRHIQFTSGFASVLAVLPLLILLFVLALPAAAIMGVEFG